MSQKLLGTLSNSLHFKEKMPSAQYVKTIHLQKENNDVEVYLVENEYIVNYSYQVFSNDYEYFMFSSEPTEQDVMNAILYLKQKMLSWLEESEAK